VSAAPRSIRVPGHGLSLHALAWDGDASRTVVILHGYLDHARSFAGLGADLARDGRAVFALDARGHGESDWAPRGGYYHFNDYVADLAHAVDALVGPSGSLSLVGHSMGGNLATMFAGAFPERVRALALGEGVGIPEMSADVVPVRLRRWLDQLRSPKHRARKKILSRDEVLARLRVSHGGVPESVLERVADEYVLPHPEGDGYTWRFDPLLQSTSPTRFDAGGFEALAREITAPVLLIDGGRDGMTFDGRETREQCYRTRRNVCLEGAGHMMHWTQPSLFSQAIVEFFSDVRV
jgi:pimeloyl-ACP methyl ester carboxylesterase